MYYFLRNKFYDVWDSEYQWMWSKCIVSNDLWFKNENSVKNKNKWMETDECKLSPKVCTLWKFPVAFPL